MPAPDTPAPGLELVLEDLDAVTDLERYASRARTMADTGMRLQVVGSVLAAWVSVLQPRGLGDRVPVALGLSLAFLGLLARGALCARVVRVADQAERLHGNRRQFLLGLRAGFR